MNQSEMLLRLIEPEPGRAEARKTIAKPTPAAPRAYTFQGLDIKAWFEAHGLELTQDEWEKDRYFVSCPWEEEHSETEERLTDSFLRDGTSEKYPPLFHCSHSHSNCRDKGHGRHDLEALARLWGDAEAFGAIKRGGGEYPLTDMGNAERMADRFAETLRWCCDRSCWLIWDGTHWREDRENQIVTMARETTRALVSDLAALGEDERKRLFAHFTKSESERGINGMVRLARALLPLLSLELDSDPWLLNFTNGTLNLQTGELRPHRREEMITRLLPFDYEPAAPCPYWEQFVATVTRNPELARFLQKAVGYSLTGSTREKCLFMLEGPTDSGKTTFLETIGNALREAGYGTQVPAEMLLAKREGGIPSDLAKCAGRRFVWTSETDDNRRLATGLIKAITGRDRISARFMHHDWFDFTSTFKLWFATNHRPTIRESGDAIWNRIRYVPFAFTVRRDEQDRELPAKLQAELPGIVRWAIDGCRMWLVEGLEPAEVMSEALSTYRREMDLVAQWIEERCVREEGLESQANALYHAYSEWARRMNEIPLSPNKFKPAMLAHHPQVERRGRCYYQGIRLMTALEAEGIGPKA